MACMGVIFDGRLMWSYVSVTCWAIWINQGNCGMAQGKGQGYKTYMAAGGIFYSTHFIFHGSLLWALHEFLWVCINEFLWGLIFYWSLYYSTCLCFKNGYWRMVRWGIMAVTCAIYIMVYSFVASNTCTYFDGGNLITFLSFWSMKPGGACEHPVRWPMTRTHVVWQTKVDTVWVNLYPEMRPPQRIPQTPHYPN